MLAETDKKPVSVRPSSMLTSYVSPTRGEASTSSVSPNAKMRPCFIRMTWLAKRAARLRSCSAIMVMTLRSAVIERTAVGMANWCLRAGALVGASNRKSLGDRMRAWQIETICC